MQQRLSFNIAAGTLLRGYSSYQLRVDTNCWHQKNTEAADTDAALSATPQEAQICTMDATST
jgi:hypothetical protein